MYIRRLKRENVTVGVKFLGEDWALPPDSYQLNNRIVFLIEPFRFFDVHINK
ncbi:MAG: hypothetical protein JWQ34_1393 [Mucilaginibacter sp.]|nr:hypothetical protein [Mucilaginibacter sp.]